MPPAARPTNEERTQAPSARPAARLRLGWELLLPHGRPQQRPRARHPAEHLLALQLGLPEKRRALTCQRHGTTRHHRSLRSAGLAGGAAVNAAPLGTGAAP